MAGDFNQNISSNKIQTFFRDIGVKDAHSIHNNVSITQLDKTHIRGSSPIDSIALSSRIMDYIEGVQLMNQNDFVMSDYRSYLLDLNLEEYFEDHFSSWNGINKVVLNLSRKSHRATFCEELVNQLNVYNIEESLTKTSLSN